MTGMRHRPCHAWFLLLLADPLPAVPTPAPTAAPAVTAVRPGNTPQHGGAPTSVTICGQTFGEYGSQPTAYYRAVKCLTTAWKSSSSVVCQPIATSSWPTSATVRVSAVSSWSSADLSFDAPRPTNIYPRNLPRTLGGGVTIYGINFFADADPTASIGLWYSASGGGTGCLTASWTSERGPLFTNTSEHADGERRGRTPAPTNIAPRQAPSERTPYTIIPVYPLNGDCGGIPLPSSWPDSFEKKMDPRSAAHEAAVQLA